MELLILYLVGGLVALVIGGEVLVRGAVGLARHFNISKLIVALTVVSFGTSAPELLVSLDAALSGHPDISIGNVIGSNIANLGLVLGVAALLKPIVVDRQTLRIDWPVMFGFSVLVILLALDYQLAWWEGALLISCLVGYIVYLITIHRRQARAEKSIEQIEELDKAVEASGTKTLLINFLLIVLGSLGLSFGADLLVKGAVGIAEFYGVPELVIATTVVAIGTSLPELVTSIMAIIRGEDDISIGNLIGSNIFNIASILGITAIVKSIPVSAQALSFDFWIMLAFAALLLPMMKTGMRLNKLEGGILMAGYITYIWVNIV